MLISPDGNLGYLLQIRSDYDAEFEEGDDATQEDVLDLIVRIVSS